MIDIVRTIHEALGIESTWAFVLIVAIITGAVGGGAAWLVDRSYKRSLQDQTATTTESKPSGLSDQPSIQRVVIRTMSVGGLEYFPEIKKHGIKVEMILDNETIPDAELQNVSGQVWTESKYLIATLRKSKSDHPWERERDRLRYRIWQPVLPKMSHEWLPTLVFALPPPGEVANFGAEIVSKTTDFRQYRWWIANESGKGVVHGGDATPNMPSIPK